MSTSTPYMPRRPWRVEAYKQGTPEVRRVVKTYSHQDSAREYVHDWADWHMNRHGEVVTVRYKKPTGKSMSERRRGL